MNRVYLLRRINLGNYEHYELAIEIQDNDPAVALTQCVELMNRSLVAFGQPKIDVEKIRP